MAKSGTRVKEFLASLQQKLLVRRDADYQKMNDLKRAELKDPKARVEPWDVAYYLNEIKKRDYTLDTEKIREYFPAETVVSGMFKVYGQLLSIDIKKVENAETWAPEVTLWEIHDKQSGEFLGNFYLDLYPRKGKYGHAAAAGVTVARLRGDHYDAPIALMMANFNPSSPGRPSLLSHDEVKTLFHEFGHIMHQTLTSARYGSQSGTSVARDFVETPSQMLENWVYEKPVLDLMSGHYQDPSRKLPEETIQKIREARSFDSGYRYTRQVFLATFDQALHTSGPVVDIDKVDQELFAQILGLQPVKEAHFAANFGHLMGGYDAGYYGYLWAEVNSDDLFTRFKAEGVLNGELGRKYRDIILARGRSEEPDELLREFLGREPNNEAFLNKLGVQ
jgi:Zn-dependent oligopeptidase